MTLDPKTFLDALLAFMAATSGLTATNPRPLWANEADSKQAADPYSVLRIYDGNLPYVPVTTLAIQCMTKGKSAAAASAQASRLYQSLIDTDGRPLTMVTIGSSPSFRVIGVTLKAPGFIGVDPESRSEVVFNFDCNAVRLS